jgi:hypothetical protein
MLAVLGPSFPLRQLHVEQAELCGAEGLAGRRGHSQRRNG